MATIQRNLSTKVDGNGKSEILLRLSVTKDKKLRIKSGLFINPKRFNAGEIIRPRANQVEAQELRELENKLIEVERFIISLCETCAPEAINKEWLIEQIDRKEHPERYETENKQTSFFDLIKEYLEKRKLSEVREKNYQVLIRALRRYEMFVSINEQQPYTLNINTITPETIEDFESFLRNEHTLYEEYPEIYKEIPAIVNTKRKSPKPQPRGNNTICALFNKLRAFFNWCNEQGKTTNRPFRGYEGTTSEKYGTPYYITLEERNQIADFNLSQHPYLAVQRDIFIFQCLIGCRVSDLLKMTKSNVINGAIEYIPRKTKEERPEIVRVPLNDRAANLIKRYAGVDEAGRLFPFISAQKYNDDIKDIFRLCGITRIVTILNPTTGEETKRPINEVASSHIARRTFVGNLYKKVKDPNLVGALSGHKEGSKAFARYRDIDEDIKKELVKMID